MTDKTKIIGILNLTEDSFSDGQIYLDENKAFNHIEKMINEQNIEKKSAEALSLRACRW